MKRRKYFLMLPAALLSLLLFAFSQRDEVIQAMKEGSAEKLARHFDTMVDISIPGKSNNYSKSQAELVVKDFFTLNKVRGFELQHSGGNPGSNFFIGNLLTDNGKFRTTVYLRQRGDKQLIQDIEFEPRN